MHTLRLADPVPDDKGANSTLTARMAHTERMRALDKAAIIKHSSGGAAAGAANHPATASGHRVTLTSVEEAKVSGGCG